MTDVSTSTLSTSSVIYWDGDSWETTGTSTWDTDTDTQRTDEEIRDIAGNLTATSSDGIITIAYNDLNSADSYLDLNIDTDLSLYDNLTSKFFSTSTDILDVAYGGTGSTSLTVEGLLIGNGTGPVQSVTMGTAGYLLMVNAGGTGYTWVSSSTAGVDTFQTDDNVRDLAGDLSATASGGVITITYVDNDDATSYLDYNIETDLSQFNNITSNFFSTSTDILFPAYGGLGANVTALGAGELLYSSSVSAYDSLAAGAIGEILMSGGAATPTWIGGI